MTVSQILSVHLGDNDTILQSELELDIREAPLRDFSLLIPADFSVSALDANSLSDYFVASEPNAPGRAHLRLVFSSPLSGRQLIGIKLEKNESPKDEDWSLPRIEPQEVKSVRGYVGVTAAEGLRLSASSSQGVAEVATAPLPQENGRPAVSLPHQGRELLHRSQCSSARPIYPSGLSALVLSWRRYRLR